MGALELSVPEVSLHVGFDVFFTPETLAAEGVEANVFGVGRGGAGDVLRYVIEGNTGRLDGLVGVKLGGVG